MASEDRPCRVSGILSYAAILALAAMLAASAAAQSRGVLLTRGPGSQIGATFRNADQQPSTRAEGGAVVVDVREKSPAAAAGIRAGDLVTEFDGLVVWSSRDLSHLIADTPPGRTVSMSVVRDGRVHVLKVTPVH